MDNKKRSFINREYLLDCNDKTAQTRSMQAHSISDKDMDVLINEWSPIPKTYSGDEIAKYINSVGTSCNYHVGFGDADFKNSSNEDIDFQILPGALTTQTTEYGIILFKGLVSLLQPLTYEFYKGEGAYGPIICFKTIDSSDLELCWNMSSSPGG